MQNILPGRLDVVTGPMYSGKTEHLIRAVNQAHRDGLKIEVYKPRIDNRYSQFEVVSHSNLRIPAILIDPEGVPCNSRADFIAIDEAQFFDDSIVENVQDLVERGIKVIVSGLDLTYSGKPFGPMPDLMAFANQVVKLTGTCHTCGSPSTRTQLIEQETKVGPSNEIPILVGGVGVYQARCLTCFLPPRYWGP